MATGTYSPARRVTVLIAGAIALGLLLTSLAASVLAAPSANQLLNVFVTNPSLAVTGTVAATQSGTWNVGITGTPTVKSGDATELVDEFTGSVAGGGAFSEVASGAVAGYKSVRVTMNCFAGGDCANITARIYAVTASARSYLLEQFTMQSFVASTRVYEVPGTSLAVQLINNNAAAVDNIGVVIYGRPN